MMGCYSCTCSSIVRLLISNGQITHQYQIVGLSGEYGAVIV